MYLDCVFVGVMDEVKLVSFVSIKIYWIIVVFFLVMMFVVCFVIIEVGVNILFRFGLKL